MIIRPLIVASVATLVLAVPIPATAQQANADLQALDDQLPGTLINDPSSLQWTRYGPAKTKAISDGSIPGGGAATRYTVTSKGAHPYDASTYVPLTANIAKGDTVTVGFYARTISADTPDGLGKLGVRFQQNADPYPGFGDTVLTIGKDWKWYEVSGSSTNDIKRDVAIVAFQLAAAKQELEIGQTIVVKGAGAILGATQPQVDVRAAAPIAELPPQLNNKGMLLNDPAARTNWAFNGPAESHADRDDGTIYLGKATRIASPGKSANLWDISVIVPFPTAVTKGDVLLLAVAAKTVSTAAEDGKALVDIRVQENRSPYAGFGDNQFKVGPNWQLIQVRTAATQDIPAGQATVSLTFASGQQTVDLGPVYILKTQ